MNRVTLNRLSYAVPFQKLFRSLTDTESSALTVSIEQFWVGYPVVTYISPTHGRAIIDGFNRASTACRIDPDREVPVDHRGELSDAVAEALALTLNADRRHLSAEDYQRLSAMRAERMKRVMTARHEGKSIRTIADIAGVSNTQVRLDLARAGVQPPSHVIGADRKVYPATRPVHVPAGGATLLDEVDDEPDEDIEPPRGVPLLDVTRTTARKCAAAAVKALASIVEDVEVMLQPGSEFAEPLRKLAREAGMPLKGDTWPVLDALRGIFAKLKETGSSGAV